MDQIMTDTLESEWQMMIEGYRVYKRVEKEGLKINRKFKKTKWEYWGLRWCSVNPLEGYIKRLSNKFLFTIWRLEVHSKVYINIEIFIVPGLSGHYKIKY